MKKDILYLTSLFGNITIKSTNTSSLALITGAVGVVGAVIGASISGPIIGHIVHKNLKKDIENLYNHKEDVKCETEELHDIDK